MNNEHKHVQLKGRSLTPFIFFEVYPGPVTTVDKLVFFFF